LVVGGWIVFDDYGDPLFPGVQLAVEHHLSPSAYAIAASPGSTQCFARKRGPAQRGTNVRSAR
jgi:precorrin-6B methylase 1